MPYSIDTDRKWQKRWAQTNLYRFDRDNADKKLYCLEMFSYPSAANLHVGHWYNYALADCFARFKRMQGFEVFQPMGFDAFGLPAENYAIKTGIHPQDSTLKNIETMEEQLRSLGGSFDWDYELSTCMPDYYRWTQWLFLKLHERGLAYRKLAPVNRCPTCETVLANEQVIDGACERCGSEVTRENLTQWFFKITEYAEELLDALPKLDWPEKTKKMQANWIGRSYGAMIEFDIEPASSARAFSVFTTRADTLFGVTYAVIAPEHPLVDAITAPEARDAVEAYREQAKKRSEIDRMSTTREKTGVPTGARAINPATGESVPIWIADYVLAGYGTGCVMAVPAHDTRDYEFAVKHGLPIKPVIAPAGGGISGSDSGDADWLPFVDDGVMTNSPGFDGLASADGRNAVVAMLEKKGKGSLRVNYRLRDWLVSRQRYWGAPIPIIHCPDCGAVPVPESDLPVLLPYGVEFTPTGESPLKKSAAFMNARCPKCGGEATRDPDTLDTFVCSSWYYLRYLDNKNEAEPFDKAWIDRMMPVDVYVGGAEHATMHLLYARFVCKALRDMGWVSCDEPFTRLIHQGMVLGADGQKMSKSLGNTVAPDEYVAKYGSDVFRMYLAFGFAFTEGGPWNDDGIRAIARFVARAERFADSLAERELKNGCERKSDDGNGSNGSNGGNGSERKSDDGNGSNGGCERGAAAPASRAGSPAAAELLHVRANSIKSAGLDIERFSFNTAISRAMELLNALYKYDAEASPRDIGVMRDSFVDLVKLIAPFAPHFAEETWERLGMPYSVFERGGWPQHDASALVSETLELAVQVNGSVRFKIVVPKDASRSEIEAAALGDSRLQAFLGGASVKKTVVVPGRLVNIVK